MQGSDLLHVAPSCCGSAAKGSETSSMGSGRSSNIGVHQVIHQCSHGSYTKKGPLTLANPNPCRPLYV